MHGGQAMLKAIERSGIDFILSSPGSEWPPMWEALAEAAYAVFEHVAARIGREGSHRLARLVRGDDRLAHRGGIGERATAGSC